MHREKLISVVDHHTGQLAMNDYETMLMFKRFCYANAPEHEDYDFVIENNTIYMQSPYLNGMALGSDKNNLLAKIMLQKCENANITFCKVLNKKKHRYYNYLKVSWAY